MCFDTKKKNGVSGSFELKKIELKDKYIENIRCTKLVREVFASKTDGTRVMGTEDS